MSALGVFLLIFFSFDYNVIKETKNNKTIVLWFSKILFLFDLQLILNVLLLPLLVH